MALRARRGYLRTFRQSLVTRDVQASELRLNVADLTTIETLVQELAHPDPKRVVYAIDVLESLDKRNLVTPLLLYHESPVVRRRALVGARRRAQRHRRSSGCRTSAACSATATPASAPPRIGALSSISQEDAASLARPAPRRSRSAHPRHGGRRDGRQLAARGRRPGRSDAARSHERHRRFGQSRAPRRRDRHPADRRSAFPPAADPAPVRSGAGRRRRGHGERPRRRAKDDFIFVPTLVSLLRNRRLKGRARAALVSLRRARRRLARVLPARSGRRHLGAAPHSRDAGADPVAEDRRRPRRGARGARRLHPLQGRVGARAPAARAPGAHAQAGESIETLAVQEARRYFNFLSLHDNLFGKEKLPADSLLAAGAASSR